MACRTCKFLQVPPDKDGKIRIRSGNAYRCSYQAEMPRLPAAITQHYSFKWPPERSYMEPDDGDECPVYQEKTK